MAGWLHTEISVRHRELNLDTVVDLSTNWVRRRLTSLIEAIALTITPDHQLNIYVFSRDLKVAKDICMNISAAVGVTEDIH